MNLIVLVCFARFEGKTTTLLRHPKAIILTLIKLHFHTLSEYPPDICRMVLQISALGFQYGWGAYFLLTLFL